MLTSAAKNAVTGLSCICRHDIFIVKIGIAIVEDTYGIEKGKNIWDRNLLWAVIFFDTVAARRTGDSIELAEDFDNAAKGPLFFIRKRFEILHERRIVRHLGKRAHAR